MGFKFKTVKPPKPFLTTAGSLYIALPREVESHTLLRASVLLTRVLIKQTANTHLQPQILKSAIVKSAIKSSTWTQKISFRRGYGRGIYNKTAVDFPIYVLLEVNQSWMDCKSPPENKSWPCFMHNIKLIFVYHISFDTEALLLFGKHTHWNSMPWIQDLIKTTLARPNIHFREALGLCPSAVCSAFNSQSKLLWTLATRLISPPSPAQFN